MQYVEGLNGETARHSRVSALAAKLHESCGLRSEAGNVNGLADELSRRQSYTVLLEVAAGSHK